MGIDTHMDFGNCSGCLRLVKISGTRLRSSNSQTMLLTILRKFEASIDNCPEPNEKRLSGVGSSYGVPVGSPTVSGLEREKYVFLGGWKYVQPNGAALRISCRLSLMWRLSLSDIGDSHYPLWILWEILVTSQHLRKGRRFGPLPLVPVVQGSRRSTCFIPMVSQGHSGPPVRLGSFGREQFPAKLPNKLPSGND